MDKRNIFGICGDGVMMVRIETGEEGVICFGWKFCDYFKVKSLQLKHRNLGGPREVKKKE